MAPRPKIRVLVVDDSLTVRRRIAEVLGGDARFRVVGEAVDGHEALELVERLRPDVVTMDMAMPKLSGLAATSHLMAHRPTPILIVSGSADRGELFQTYDALAAGAVDVLEKPGYQTSPEVWAEDLRARVARVARIKVITHVAGLRTARPRPPAARAAEVVVPKAARLVGIGTSTGGPSALLALFRAMPADFALPVVVVLHISEAFAAAFAAWLEAQTGRVVRLVRDGEPVPRPGRPDVLLAVPGRHLVVADGALRLVDTPERHSCRPSVDVFFEGLARAYGRDGVGVLLTGMGTDGAAGLKAIRDAGGQTIAQDEQSSVVWGMPGEAVRLGAVERLLPPDAIGRHLGSLAGAGGRRGA